MQKMSIGRFRIFHPERTGLLHAYYQELGK
jgi:hypothetical protein